MGPLGQSSIVASKPPIAIVLVAIMVGIFFLLGTSENYVYADDSLPFVVRIQIDPEVKVHHLMLSVLYQLNKTLGYVSREELSKTIALVKLYVAATSSLALAMVGVLAYRWYGSTKAAMWALFFTSFSYGFWAYSITTDFYVPAAAFALLAILLAELSFTSKRPYMMLACTALAVLVSALNHQAFSLIVLPIAVGLLFCRIPKSSWNARMKRATMFVTLTATVGLGVFFVSFLAADGGRSNFITYVQGYAGYMKLTPYDKVQWLTPAYSLIGIGRALVFPDYVLHFGPVYERIHNSFLLKLTFDDMYLVREIPKTMICLLVVLNAGLVIACVWLLLRVARSYRRRLPPPAGMLTLIGWIGCQAIFFSWWEPLSNEMWIWFIPCVGLLLSGADVILYDGRSNAILRWGIVLTLIVVNGPVISKYWSGENDIYRINKTYLVHLAPNDIAVTQNFYQPKALELLVAPNSPRIDFYYDRGGFRFADSAFQAILRDIHLNGGRVFLDPMLVMPERSETALFKYLSDVDDNRVEEGLIQLEWYCSAHNIPLYAVERIGDELIHFERRTFTSYTKWVDCRLNMIP
jgi:hypothetical protein